jgi:hypothetical protein
MRYVDTGTVTILLKNKEKIGAENAAPDLYLRAIRLK